MRVRIALFLLTLFMVGCKGVDAAGRNTSYVYPPWQHTWGVVRATPFKLRLFVGNRTHFNDPQGLVCVRLDAWEDTSRSGDDDEITAYGVNSGDNCIIYNGSMFSLAIYGLDEGHERFDQPWGIAADRQGRVYVADRGNHRLVRLINPGRGMRFVSSVGGPGDAPGRFVDPRGVALDSWGRVYATDAGLGRVTVFDDSGRVIDIWEGFEEPDAVAVTDPGELWSYYPHDGFAVVIDSLHQRIRKLSLEGELLDETCAADWGMDDAFLAYVTLDYHNQLLVTDKRNCCIHKLDRDLNYLTKFGERGRGDYQFDEPRGIAIYRRFGQLLVAERLGAQYLWVAVDVPRFEARVVESDRWRDLNADFFLSEPAFCQMDVLDSYGRFVARLMRMQRYDAGAGHMAWGMRIPGQLPGDESLPPLPPEYRPGEMLPKGEYLLRARFRAIYSSREDFYREVEAKFKVGR